MNGMMNSYETPDLQVVRMDIVNPILDPTGGPGGGGGENPDNPEEPP